MRMRWDIFCKVIDNHGDLGVCWRLSTELAARGQAVRLWLDDWRALAWMAPQVGADGLGHPGIEVCPWPQDEATLPADLVLGDVMIEAFGCDLPDAIVARMQRPCPPCWINLEYLSAEAYVERSHRLVSPVWSGPGAGLRKHFFYPGFTVRTGGLLRQADALVHTAALRAAPRRAAQLNALVADQPITPEALAHTRVISLFCYPQSPVQALLNELSVAWQQQGQAAGALPWRVLITPGPATAQVQALQSTGAHWPGLVLAPLPPCPQEAFDDLLRLSDLNFVRGEDSAVQALWAGQPHCWQIYRQDDGVHATKLHAFMDLWMAAWPHDIKQLTRELWSQWNDLPRWQAPDHQTDLSALGQLLSPPQWDQWQAAALASAQDLARQADLATQLLDFVTQAG
jgi:uncharacterized repeat protein (TIGR03837 family)